MIDPNVLASRVILAFVNISVWTGAKRDRMVANEIAHIKKAASDAGSYTKYLVPKDKLDPVIAAAQNVRVYHYKNTVAWDDNGARALPVEKWFDYQAGIEEYSQNFRDEVQAFSAWYAENWNSYQVRLGEMFNPKEYPYPDEVSNRFRINTSYRQIMTPDFRVQLPEEIGIAVKQSQEEGFKNGIMMAHKECWARIADMMEKVAVKLEDPNGIFRDTMIENIAILVYTLRPLNIGDNHELKKCLDEVDAELATAHPDWLRVDKPARAKAAAAARRIFEQARLHTD